MIKRMIVSVLVATAALAPMTGAHAASLSVYRYISVYYQSGSNAVSTYGVVVEDLTGNNAPVAFGSIYVANQNGTDQGSGPLQVTLDPLSNAGQLTGTVTGNSGPLTVDVTFAGSNVATNQIPFAFADLAPDPIQVSAGLFTQRFGHGIGSATSAFGTVNIPNAFGYAAHGLTVAAP